MGNTPRPAPRREKARAATIEEIKRTAVTLMHEHGTADLKFTDIARAMDMTPPALYRYFADRDALLSELITDAYNDLGTAVAEARDALPADDIAGRFRAITHSYRRWAREEPQRFALIFGLPVSGYVAPEDGSTTEAAQRAMSQMSALFVEALMAGRLGPPRIREVHPAIAACAETKNDELPVAIPADTFQAMLHVWSSLHGFVSLEAYGHFAWIDEAGVDALFETHARLTAQNAGLPVD
ncbi:TetR/AcrR family transcriptional regulator [Dactylosporangium sp. McL0621]|uniref:TetR/AcrR family transcriptional regulator n=1 Tax=Dactylosporangium sp. McL0621 TaxID=3415678 RepID=UPI003CFBB4F7